MSNFNALVLYVVVNAICTIYLLSIIQWRVSALRVLTQTVINVGVVYALGLIHVNVIHAMSVLCVALVPFQAVTMRAAARVMSAR